MTPTHASGTDTALRFDLRTIAPTAGTRFEALQRATEHLEPPFAVVDLGALAANARSLTLRASGKPIRLATKSVRCRAISDSVLALDGFQGILALTLPEALWLAETCDDVVVGYPSADKHALAQLASDADLAQRVTVMADSIEQLDFIERVIPADGPPIRVCLDLDASLRLLGGRVHLGTRRSPIHAPAGAADFARAIKARRRFRLVGLMAYEGQIAGLGDDTGSQLRKLYIRAIQAVSVAELASRRAAAVSSVREIVDLEFVNGGGTGSVETTVAEDAITEVAAGSGLYCPALFDGYRRFKPVPAAFFVTSVVRRPAPTIATVLGGGWVASGTPGRSRLPSPVWPRNLRLTSREGAGEAQTPLTNAPALQVGDRVWFRHAKAGELCERVGELHLVDGDRLVATVPTYRGDNHAFL